MKTAHRSSVLALSLILLLALSFLPVHAQDLIPGMVTVQDNRCTVTYQGETLADFPVEDPVYATLTTTSQGGLAVVVTWGNFTEEEKRIVLLPPMETLQLEGEFSLVRLSSRLPDDLTILFHSAAANSLQVSCPGQVTAGGEIGSIYLSNPDTRITLEDDLSAVVYNYHNLSIEGGDDCEILSSIDITRRQQESWKKDRPASSTTTTEPEPEPGIDFSSINGTFSGVATDVSFNLWGADYPYAKYEFEVINGVIQPFTCTWGQHSDFQNGTINQGFQNFLTPEIHSDGSFSSLGENKNGLQDHSFEGQFIDLTSGTIRLVYNSGGYAEGPFTLVS